MKLKRLHLLLQHWEIMFSFGKFINWDICVYINRINTTGKFVMILNNYFHNCRYNYFWVIWIELKLIQNTSYEPNGTWYHLRQLLFKVGIKQMIPIGPW